MANESTFHKVELLYIAILFFPSDIRRRTAVSILMPNAEHQCNLIICGRISSQIKLPHNFLKSLSQHI